MASSDSGCKEKIIRLSGKKNWNVWKFAIEISLESKELKGYVDGTIKEPNQFEADGSLNDDYAPFKKKDLKAREMIVKRIEEGPMAHILSCTTAEKMWEKLCSIYENKSDVSVNNLQAEFFHYKYDNQGIAKYISGLEGIRNKLLQLNEKISDNMFITKILTGLPDSFRHFHSAWDSTPDNRKNINELTSRLLLEEERLKKGDRNDSAALVSKNFNSRKNFRSQKGNNSNARQNLLLPT